MASRRRYHKKSTSDGLGLLLSVGLVGFGLWQMDDPQYDIFGDEMTRLAHIVILSFLLLVLGVYLYRVMTQQRRSRNFALLQAHGIDTMTGKEFEIFLSHLLIARGYDVKGVYHQRDGGVDIVARKEDESYSIQAKRYRGKVNRRAVTDAVAGKSFRDCTQAMVITNSFFTYDAKQYASKTKCHLIDRELLAQWVRELQPNE